MIRTTTCALLLLVPAPALAQGLSVSPFLAQDRGLAGAPSLIGISVTGWSGAFGLRLGGAVDVPSSPAAPLFGHPPSAAVGAWSGDLDMVFSGRRAGLTLGRVEPAAFVGFGVHGARAFDGDAATVPTWSYGAGAALPVADWLTVEGEARYRMPHTDAPETLPSGVGAGWELRAGLALHLGGRTARPRGALPATIHIPSRRRDSSPAAARVGGGARPATDVAAGRSDAAAALVTRTLDEADRHVGVPYVWGGNTPAEGFDCSGFVRYVYARNGVSLPRVSRDQARAGSPLPLRLSAALPGDLLFFAGNDGVVSHVAIYAGDGWIIHSAGSRGRVAYDHLDSRSARWYATHMVGIRRVIH